MVVLTWVLGAVSVLGIGGSIAALIFYPLVAVPALEKVTQTLLGCKTCLVVAALVATAIGSYWYGHHGEYKRGHTAAIAEIAAEDATALTNALASRDAWKECRAHDGTWDQSTGECK